MRIRYGIAILVLALACGRIANPDAQEGQSSAKIGTVKGAFTGSFQQDGLHVALVWQQGRNHAWRVIGDAPVALGGSFTIDVTAPPSDFFFDEYDDSYLTPPSPTPNPPPASSSSLGFRDGVSGAVGSSGEKLLTARAGFVVYKDKNGNGQLDLDAYLNSVDTFVAGSGDFSIAYYKGGSALDYEKRRDSAGQLPHEGVNLRLGSSRYVALDLVQLSDEKKPALPYDLCSDWFSDGVMAAALNTSLCPPSTFFPTGSGSDPPPPPSASLDAGSDGSF